MRVDRITKMAFTTAFRRLLVAYDRQLAANALTAMLEVYFDAVDGLPEAAVLAGMRALENAAGGDGHRYLPKKGQVRAAVMEHVRRAEHDHARQHAVDDDMCPHCRRAFWVAGYEVPGEVVVGRRRCICPQAGHGWNTELATAWRETTPPDWRILLGANLRRTTRRMEGLTPAIVPVDGRGDAWEPEEAA